MSRATAIPAGPAGTRRNYEGGFYKTSTDHEIEFDTAGFNPRPRYTCYTCEGATLVAQPWMDSDRWAEEKKKFFAVHGELDLTSYSENRRGLTK